jgi:ferrochelatase
MTSDLVPATTESYDSILLISFGGPEGRDDVIPFLENVLRGRPVPRERMLEVAEHYYHFGGVSPINGHCRELIAVLRQELDSRGIYLPIYWGNRNWTPMLPDTLRKMTADGRKRAIGVVTAAYSSYSSCRQYRENVQQAQAAVDRNAPQVDKLRVFYNHPLFISANRDRVADALNEIPGARRSQTHIVYSAHSIPLSMSNQCDYVKQLTESCRLVSESLGIGPERWKLVYQSRSGRPEDPWLDPDVNDYLKELRTRGVTDVVVMPIGFLSDHMEVLFDLDEEARESCQEIGLNMVRAKTVGVHPDFVRMVAELIQERMSQSPDRVAVGQYPASHDVCPIDCCPAPVIRRPASAS